ncbi:MAG: hypothetical protein QOD55_2320 [Solirubrobacteraceae bacterium]|jgi:hypothetical protein|nr:hypothetical protein [Solirubrobacteraceae bacterium]
MAEHIDPAALFTLADEGWSVRAHERRIVFVNGASSIEIPVDGTLRWAQDGDEISFARLLETVPARMHGWVSLAALIGLRHCLAAQLLAVALPPGCAEWAGLARRARPIVGWMEGLAGLDGIDVPSLPDVIDDGLSELFDDRPG